MDVAASATTTTTITPPQDALPGSDTKGAPLPRHVVTKDPLPSSKGDGKSVLPNRVKMGIIAVAMFLLHALPMLWVIHCALVLLWLFPLMESLLWNILLLVSSLLLFIVSGVNLKDFYVRRTVTAAMLAITVHHFLHGHFFPLISLPNLIYTTWLLLPIRSYFAGNIFRTDRVSQWYQGLPLWKMVADTYFPLTVVRDQPPNNEDDGAQQDEDADKNRKYFFVYHPHGLWPWGLWLALVTRWKDLFPNVSWRVLIATPLLLIPYLGDYMQAIGGISADWETCGKAVAEGNSLVVLPGGLAETMLSDPTHYAILLKPRRGFIKLAIVHGLSLVPVFGFGETKLFHQISACRDIRMQLSRKTGFPITLFAGAYGSTLPRRSPITVVIGQALHVQQNATPSEEEITQTYNRYEAALLDLYNRHKPDDAGPLAIL